jgi:hypothetical protein
LRSGSAPVTGSNIIIAAAVITQSVKALAITCYGFAKDFAPGRQAKNSDQSADVFAPGQEKKETNKLLHSDNRR